MIKNYGLKINETKDPNAYILGGLTSLPKIVLQPSGDWSAFLPIYEPQFGGDWDSYGCTVWGTENAVETILKKLTGQEYNFSERFIYNIAEIEPPGADPHWIAKVIRENGLIPDVTLPMTKTYREFITPRPMSGSLLAVGQQWRYKLKHEYVWDRPQTREQRTTKIREYLKYSPLGVAVTAWIKEGDVYVDGGQPNTHWCVLFAEAPNGWLIFDSYDQSVKTLSFDHNIGTAKRYLLVPQTPPKNWLVDLVERLNLIRIIKEIVVNLKKIPSPEPSPNMTPSERLLELAVSKLGTDFTNDMMVSDEVSCAFAVTTILHELNEDIPIITGTWNLLEYLEKSLHFEQIYEPEAGCIVIAATGTGMRPEIIPAGHTGIYRNETEIMSNDSVTGLWSLGYTRETFRQRYYYRGGYPIRLFRKVV